MSFHLTAQDARIEVGACTMLHATLQRADGSWDNAVFNLDEVLGNEDGHFQWGGQNFTQTAEDIRFDPHEGAADQPILRALLRDREGELHPRDVNLSEIIENVDGQFAPKF